MKLLMGTLLFLVVVVGCQNAPTSTPEDKALTAVKALLDDWSDIDARGDWNWTLLHWATNAYLGYSLVAGFEGMADPDVLRALQDANGKGNPVIVKALLDAGADPNVSTRWGETPLFYATREVVDPGIVQALLDAGADPNSKFYDTVRTPLHWAAYDMYGKSHPEAVRALLDAGADPHATDEDDRTPLHEVARNDPETVQVLLDAGADPNARGNFGDTPLHWAATRNNPETVQVLLDAGADPNAEDRYGRTPLFVAEIMYGNDATADLLRGQ